MDTRHALKKAVALGAKVSQVRRTGEIKVVAKGHRRVRTQHWTRRKSASRELEVLIKKLERERGAA